MMVAVDLVLREIVARVGIPVRGLAVVRVPDLGAAQVVRAPAVVTSTWRLWGRDSERISPINVAKGAAVHAAIVGLVVRGPEAVRADLVARHATAVLRRLWRAVVASP